MNMILRNSALSLAVVLTLALAGGHLRAGSGLRMPRLVAPPAPVDAALKVQTKGGMILVAKMVVKPASPPRARGAALRDKGEALGGGARERVEMSTMTLAAQ